MNAQMLARCRKVFDETDVNNSGGIDCFELLAALRKHFPAVTLPEIMDQFNECDLDHNGEIDFNEFMIIMNGFKLSTTNRFESDQDIDLIFQSLREAHGTILDTQQTNQSESKISFAAIRNYLETFDLSIDSLVDRIREKEMSLARLEAEGIDIVTFRKIFFT